MDKTSTPYISLDEAIKICDDWERDAVTVPGKLIARAIRTSLQALKPVTVHSEEKERDKHS